MSPETTSGATAKVIPQAPSAPTRGSNTLPSQVEADWPDLIMGAETGGLAIVSYELEYDQGTGQSVGGGSWITLMGNPSYSTLTIYQVASVSGGVGYQFRVRARNVIGWGPWSSIGTIYASSEPGQMSTAVTAIDAGSDPLRVKITWSAPDSNYDAITEYEVVVRTNDLTSFVEEPTECDGTGNTSMTTGRHCLIQLTTLRAAPYNLVRGDLVAVKVRARNSIGFGTQSQPNVAGATIQTEPA